MNMVESALRETQRLQPAGTIGLAWPVDTSQRSVTPCVPKGMSSS